MRQLLDCRDVRKALCMCDRQRSLGAAVPARGFSLDAGNISDRLLNLDTVPPAQYPNHGYRNETSHVIMYSLSPKSRVMFGDQSCLLILDGPSRERIMFHGAKAAFLHVIHLPPTQGCN